MKKKSDWAGYYEITSKNPPSKILVEALKYLENKQNALELGAGTPKDSTFLLEKGFNVTAVDREPSSEKVFEKLKDNKKFKFSLNSFEDFNYKQNHYDLVSAQRSLPFIQKKNNLFKVFSNIRIALKNGGIFAGHFFGPNDTWRKEGKEMTFVDEEEIRTLLGGMEVIKLTEREEDSQTASGTPHHWHVFDVIARKK